MARISLDRDKFYPYVLESEMNEDHPVTVHIKHVNFGKSQQYVRRAEMRIKKDKRNETQIWKDIQKEQFIENVSHIENWDHFGRPITPEEFYEEADPKDIYEVLKAMEDGSKLTGLQIKNSEGGSDTQSQSNEMMTPPHSTVEHVQIETQN